MDIMAQTREIYNHLCDEKSKRIFENRLLYSLTDNYGFVNNIVKLSFEESIIEEYKDELHTILGDRTNGVIIYGAGFNGEKFVKNYGNFIDITAFCDSDIKKHGSIFFGYKIISPEQLMSESENVAVVISIYNSQAIGEITEKLVNMGVKKNLIFTPQDICRATLYSTPSLRKEEYFNKDIIIPCLSEDEVFIDGGCCDCYTDIQFVNFSNSKYKKIIAFEPNPKQYPLCVENSKSISNITIHPYGLWNENTELIFDNGGLPGSAHISDHAKGNALTIKTVKLDDILDGDKATFIKLDIEGAELNALKGAEQTILKYRPKLAICLYHKPEDIWEIPAYILSLHDDYKLYIRHYTFRDSGTVLYAV